MSMADADGRRRTGGRSLAAIAVATCGLAAAPSAALADAGLGVTPTMPDVVALNATGISASLTLTNLNTAPETVATICNAGDPAPCPTGGQGITFVPSCAGQDPVSLGCAVPNTGVFRVGSTAKGAAGTTCAGMTFTVEPLNDAAGTVRFKPPAGPNIQLLTPGATCRIDFTLDMLAAPRDVDAARDGLQTIQLASASQRSERQKVATGHGRAIVTVTPPPPPPTAPPPAPPTAPPPGPPTAPQSGVSPVTGSSASPGSAKIKGPSGCVTKNFNVTVTGKQIRRVVFRLNGKTIKTLTRPNAGRAFRLPVRPGTLKRGTHHITATTTFTRASGTRSRTLRVTFLRCSRSATSPQFTG